MYHPQGIIAIGTVFVKSCALPEAGVRQKNVFSLISQENTCVGDFFLIKLQAEDLQLY